MKLTVEQLNQQLAALEELNESLLKEAEHKLVSPELIGTDGEKTAAIQFWASLVCLLRTLNTTLVSFDNKVSVLNAIRAELATLETEINNDTAKLVPGEAVPTLDQAPEAVVDLTKPEVNPLDQLKANAGIGYAAPYEPKASAPTPNVSMEFESKKHLKTFSKEAIEKMRRNAGVR